MTKIISISDLFSGFGVPRQTYVAQEKGLYETQLKQGLKELGTLCLITGSSKTGKTTLYHKVLDGVNKTPLVIRCDSTIDSNEFWKRPLEVINFSVLKEVHAGKTSETNSKGKIGGKIGWEWFAGLIGEVSLSLKKGKTETEIREAIISKPSPNQLIPLLKTTNAILVVEDFHYLDAKTQKEVFQQWKAFIDDGVSVIVVGTTHHGVDLAYANPDLVGRIQQIDLMRWSKEDLNEIGNKEFNKLGIETPQFIINLISEESAGLPIITQQACGQLFVDKDIFDYRIGEPIVFNEKDAFNALHHVAINRYKQFESWYTRLTTGPRKAARKYNTYELLLSAFTLDPLKFELKRHEIDERISRMPVTNSQKPPAASINSTLSALEKFQKNNGFELLEWSKRDQAIFVLEPAFLFFLRWREARTTAPKIHDILDNLIKATTALTRRFTRTR